MSGDFFDTNVLLYLTSSDPTKAAKAKILVAQGGAISVQVLNEIAHVIHRKSGRPWNEIRAFLATMRGLLDFVPLTVEIHEAGILLAERYRLSTYDAMIVSAALSRDCERLWSEDMHHGLLVEGRLRIVNPFR